MKKILMACLMALGIFAWGNAGITPAEAADYYVTDDQYGHQYWVEGESISHVSDWGECMVKLTNGSGGKLLGRIHYTFGVNSAGRPVYKASNYDSDWHYVNETYVERIEDFVFSH